ncbi:MAG: aromatic ring-hydroxylating dioxygenase subunit alpha [Candidatus Eisenbacteria bacterium]
MDRWETLRIDPDIRTAHTLPAWVYADPGSYVRQRERVFAPSWQWVADTADLRVPGQTLPVTLLEGMLDEPLVLTRDRDDRTHCLSNVCTHRGTLVCEGAGVEHGLRCRYHGRRFHLDGRFHSMPGFEGARVFPSPADDLPKVAHGTWGPLMFASLAPAATLERLIEPLVARCGHLPLADASFDPTRSREYPVAAHWALYIENFLEGFHIAHVHAGLAAALESDTYRNECFEWGTLQTGFALRDEDAFAPPADHPDHGRRVAAWWFWLYPNTMVNVYPWGVSLNVVRPLAPDRTRVSFRSYVWDASRLGQGAGAALDRVEREDEAVVESVQRGVRSRLYTSGRYSPAHEGGVHHFHRLLAAALAG